MARKSNATVNTASAVEPEAPVVEQIAPVAEQPAPETEQPAPEAEQTTPEAEQLAPETEQPTPETEQPTPEAEQTAPEAEQTPPETKELVVVASPSGLNLRVGPSAGFKAIQVLPDQSVLEVLPLPMGAEVPGWVLVATQDETPVVGWVNDRYLSAVFI